MDNLTLNVLSCVYESRMNMQLIIHSVLMGTYCWNVNWKEEFFQNSSRKMTWNGKKNVWTHAWVQKKCMWWIHWRKPQNYVWEMLELSELTLDVTSLRQTWVPDWCQTSLQLTYSYAVMLVSAGIPSSSTYHRCTTNNYCSVSKFQRRRRRRSQSACGGQGYSSHYEKVTSLL